MRPPALAPGRRCGEDDRVSASFRLRAGDHGPTQQSEVTCGAACLTVARMLVDVPFAAWIERGEGHPVPGAEGATRDERFAAYEGVVHARTTAGHLGATGARLPWPRALGTPPWGARAELESGASAVGTRYTTDVLRHRDRAGLAAAFAGLVTLVADGQPALLYVGDRWLPRHVTLVLPGDGRSRVEVYEPATGLVRPVRRPDLTGARLRLGGWDQPWFLVRPTGHRAVRAGAGARVRLPRLARDPSPEALHRR